MRVNINNKHVRSIPTCQCPIHSFKSSSPLPDLIGIISCVFHAMRSGRMLTSMLTCLTSITGTRQGIRDAIAGE
nr:MAG TPA: hypothetical protein [Caudoviricetes sp.]